MSARLSRLSVKAAVTAAIVGGLTLGASSLAQAREIVTIEDGRSCVPVCKVADGHYTDWFNC